MGGHVVIVGNTKGGVGKTALAFNLAHSLAELGVRTLAVDFDVQCGLGAFLHEPPPDADRDTGAVVMQRCALGDAVRTIGPNLELLPAEEYSMAHLSRRLERDEVRERGRELLAELFEQLRRRWDVIVVDTAGHQSPLLALAMSVADGVVVPISPEAGPVAELTTVLNMARAERQEWGRPDVLGIVRTRVWGNAVYRRVAEDQIRSIAAARGVRLYRNKIPEDAKFGEAHLLGLAVAAHQPRARSAVAYRFLARELVDTHGWATSAPAPLAAM